MADTNTTPRLVDVYITVRLQNVPIDEARAFEDKVRDCADDDPRAEVTANINPSRDALG